MSVRKRQWLTAKGEPREAWIVSYADADGDRHIETFARKKDADASGTQQGANGEGSWAGLDQVCREPEA